MKFEATAIAPHTSGFGGAGRGPLHAPQNSGPFGVSTMPQDTPFYDFAANGVGATSSSPQHSTGGLICLGIADIPG
ncbi:hypothetical protein [Phenylobacterium sp.]|uniref:hypothetical protein n=1 Tax=Phenylobacterium sp. TaxID=1871053 RepID=UPI002F42F3F2